MTMEVHTLAYPWTFTYFKKVASKSYEDNTYTLGTTATVEDFWRLYVHLRRPVDERPTVCDYHVFREGIRPMWEDEANVNGGKWIVRLKKGLAARYWEDVVRYHVPCLVPLGHPSSRPPCAPRPTRPRLQLLAILGGQFRVGDEICGCVLSVRYQEDILSIWNKSADSRRVCMQIRDTMRAVMSLPDSANMECTRRGHVRTREHDGLPQSPAVLPLSPHSCPAPPHATDKKHTDSMRDNSSYRNTNTNF